jgi:hypothetical protein
MKIIIKILLLAMLLFPCSISIRSKEWRGIVPLHSSRADVERLLGQGTNWCKCSYYFDDMNIFFVYSSGDCKNGGSGGWNIPPDTVIRFSVVLIPQPRWSDLKFDLSKFRKQNDPEIEGIVEYHDDEDGFLIEGDQERVYGFYYWPSAKDKNLRCSN